MNRKIKIHGQKADYGYTLIEVVMVIALLGLLYTMVAPNFKNTLVKYKLQVAAQELAQNIRLAQQKTIAEGVSYKIVFNLDKMDNYQLLYGRRGKLIKLPSGVFFDWTTYADVDKTLVFNPSGAPNRGGTIAIKSGNNKLYVIVSVATGRVRIGKVPP
jgi:prepilin-type N-terminal cleavage/methylation domain-containing protein